MPGLHQPEVAISLEDPIGAVARKLIGDLCAEMIGRYGTPPSPFSSDEAAAARTIYLVARVGRDPVGCGALRQFSGDIAEIKRMYVAPAGRRQGIARRILLELESAAARLGYRIIRLETGIRQPEAQRLYESLGYLRIGSFGPYADNPSSVCCEKHLRQP